MKHRRALGIALLGTGLVVLSCSADRGSVPAATDADASVSTASAAATRIAELRARFPLAVHAPEGELRFEAAAGPDAGTHVRAVLSKDALRGVARSAHVALPVRADGDVELEDDTSHLSVRFALGHVRDARLEVAGGMALYRGALDGADVVHRVHAEGTEDFVVFETRPAHEELSYAVDVSQVPGLRLVSNTLEFLDATGTPVLRVAPPYVVDASGQRHGATLAVDGCAYDTNPAGPWGRTVTKPGAPRCAVRVAWTGLTYPAMVDPAWSATGSLATARSRHTASVLPSGKVLFAGGCNGLNCTTFLSSAELYDPAGNAGVGTFAATGSMATVRRDYTASVLLSGKVLLAGGASAANTFLASAELYDPATGLYAATGALATARSFYQATMLPSGKVFVAGGYNGSPLASAELYDPAGNAGAGSFAATGSLATGRWDHTASVLASGKVLVAGGFDGSKSLASAELYDPAGNAGVGSFAATGSMATARFFPVSSVLASGKVLVAGGVDVNGNPVASAELFDPAGNAGAGAFAATGSMATGRWGHTGSVLASGKVLVAGGNNAGYLASVELYDPAGNAGAGSFAAAGSMATARFSPTASVLASGKVLVAGGENLASAELFAVQATGAACAAGGDCVSGVCEDGICCSGPCSGACMTCTAGTGACVAVTSADDPDTCTAAHTCDVSGTCKLKLGQACPGGNGDCANAQCVDGYCCNAVCNGGGCDRCDLAGKEGTCSVAPAGNPGLGPVCAPYVCDGVTTPCPLSCATDAGCALGSYCAANGTCQPQKAQASVCNTQANCKQPGCRECTSLSCVDGFCCGTACNGVCQACAAALKQDGIADGTCGPTKDGADPRNECAASGVLCGADGQCNGAGACRLYTPASVSCGAGVCQGTLAKGQLCDGAGTCAANAVGVDCAPFLCANGGCTTSCVTSSECAASAWCKAGTCMPRVSSGSACLSGEACSSGFCADGVCCDRACTGQCEACDSPAGTCGPIAGTPRGGRPACSAGSECSASTNRCESTCDGDHTTKSANGTTEDCSPYKCDLTNGACRALCSSSNDCVAPGVCDPTGKCAPPAADASSGGGCNVANPGAGAAGGHVACLAAFMALVIGRRRRRSGASLKGPLVLGLALLAGCASTPRLVGHVSSFHVLDASSKEFVILPTQGEESSLEFRSYADLVRKELVRRGWRDTPYETAGVLVFLQYQIGRGRQVVFSYPIYGATGMAGGTGVVGEGIGSETVFDRAMQLTMYAAPAYREAKRWEPLFEGVVHSSGGSGSLPPVMPALIQGLFADFPGKSGGTREISIPIEDH